MQKCLLLAAISISFFCSLNAQPNNLDIPFKVGIVAEYGTHIQRLGFVASFFTTFRNHEFDLEYKSYFNFKNLGPSNKYWENSFTAAYTYGFGKSIENHTPSTYFKPIISHLDEKYAVSYALTFFFNKIGSQQSIGRFSFYIDNWIISSENDLFGNFKGRDRFRTGSFTFGYHSEEFLYMINTVLWTGDGKCAEAKKYTAETSDASTKTGARFGFKDISKCFFGKFSHGILNGQITYKPNNFFDQNYTVSTGVDSEKVRHFIQNKIIHDMYFLPPAFINSKNLHYPILDENGEPFLDEKKQKIKRDRFYFRLGQNVGDNY